MNMDKQIVFYNSEYQFYYSPKNKTISAPQISGKQNDDYSKSWVICFGLVVAYWIVLHAILPVAMFPSIMHGILLAAAIYATMPAFFKAKTHFDFSLKWIWYIVFSISYIGGIVTLIMAGGTYSGYIHKATEAIYVLIYLSVGIALIYKKKIKAECEEYVSTPKNKKILKEVLRSNYVKYKWVMTIEIPIIFFLIYWVSYAGFKVAGSVVVPLLTVAVFQRNIYYLFLIRKIAKQYGISLKSKDVLEENDAEAEKQINAENKANEEHGTNTKNISTTENEMNAEINTAKEIVTENKATAKNETNSETNTSTQSNSTQNSNKLSDKQ